MPPDWARFLANVDHHPRLALVVEAPGDPWRLIAVARYERTGEPDRRMAFVVRDDWKGRGLGTILFGELLAAANTAFANRQIITHRVREVMGRVFGRDPRELGLSLIYDVCHNTAKLERHVVDGTARDLVVHRKGALVPSAPARPTCRSRTGTSANP